MTNKNQLQDLIKQVLLTVHPVGSLFITEDSRNPDEILFAGGGTTWEKIEGRVILGSSASHAVGQKGGEETHALTLQETPAHTHNRGDMNINGSFNVYWSTVTNPAGAFTGEAPTKNGSSQGGGTAHQYYDKVVFNANKNWTGNTSSAGGGQPHNNMMPYEVFNIWKRTA